MGSFLRLLYRWGPAVAWMIFIFTFSGFPQRPPTPGLETFRWDDKMQHFAAYALLAVLVWWALAGAYTPWRRAIISGTISIIYAITDELHQYFIPGRQCSISDIYADAAGAIIAAVLLAFIANSKYMKSKHQNGR